MVAIRPFSPLLMYIADDRNLVFIAAPISAIRRFDLWTHTLDRNNTSKAC